MKKFIIAISILSGLAFTAPAYAAGTGPESGGQGKPVRSDGFNAVLDKTDAICLNTIDLSARYWADQIMNKKNSTYTELEEKSNNWIMKQDTKKLLFEKIKAFVDAGKVEPLNAEERKKLDEANKEIRILLSPKYKGTVLAGDKNYGGDIIKDKLDKIDRATLDLSAKYWADRIINQKNTTYAELEEKSKNWIMKQDTKELLLKKIKTYTESGKVAQLTKKEQAELKAAREKQHAILFPKPENTAAADISQEDCIKLYARYWAWRIQGGESGILENIKTKWNLSETNRTELINEINGRLKVKNKNLTKEEQQTYNICIKRLSLK